MEKKGFPTRLVRWCCAEYKENSFKDSVLIMGIRAEESVARAKRWSDVSYNKKTNNKIVNPIFKWSSERLWEFVREYKVLYCELYDQGFKRLGCIGCPMSGKHGRKRDFDRWPKFEKKWKRAFRRIWERRTKDQPFQRDGREWFGTACFDSWEQMWFWWLNDKPLPDSRQLRFSSEMMEFKGDVDD
jgi:phosphoadenosine phosphosulfate reductase